MGSSKMSALIAVMIMIVIAAVATTKVAEGRNPRSCVSKLIPCVSYLNSTRPPAECCNPLREAVSKERECMCKLFENPGFLGAFGINATNGLKILGHCGIPDFISTCKELGLFLMPSNSREAHDLSSIPHNSVDGGDKEDEGIGRQWVEVISEEPRAIIYHNFLSKEECESLINISKPHMQPSTITEHYSRGHSRIKKDTIFQTGSITILARGHDKTVSEIEKRIADFTSIPVENGEGFVVLHHEVGQKFLPHYDFFIDGYNRSNGGQIIATVIMYLSDVEEGGETVFPEAKGNISVVPCWNEMFRGQRGLSVKPKRGDALLLWSLKPDATLDFSTVHGSCPVIRGNKWSSTKSIRAHEYKE
ncbi:hypothetical protein ACH5RR_038604 [Cinchona calisaya]|uniref:Fe2OG dioxygenase domain-containing protein n=1 Tax=Cinchona calisaya TaxID=153742 RepID=A0ABD2XYA6_9GENT